MADTKCGGTAGRGPVFSRLYTGTGAFDVVGRRKIWYVAVRHPRAGVRRRRSCSAGSTSASTSPAAPRSSSRRHGAAPATVEDVRRSTSRRSAQEPAAVQTVGQGAAASVLIRSEPLDAGQIVAVKQALFDRFQPLGSGGQPSVSSISITDVSGTWGGQITRQALIALAVFLVLVTIFLAFYFERAMAVAALVALVHDVVVTMGIYSLVGFEVTPATAIGLLTILGLLALRHRRGVRQGQGEHARAARRSPAGPTPRRPNLALNQTLMRSINTSLIAVLPVLGPDGRRRRAARRRHAGRPRARADRRHPGGRGRRCCWRPRCWSTSRARPPHPRAGRAGRRPRAPRRPRRRPAGGRRVRRATSRT